MNEADNPCPHCGATDLGDIITIEQWREHIGIEDPKVYDGISWWQCCECGHIWKRFPWSPDYVGA